MEVLSESCFFFLFDIDDLVQNVSVRRSFGLYAVCRGHYNFDILSLNSISDLILHKFYNEMYQSLIIHRPGTMLFLFTLNVFFLNDVLLKNT